MASNATPCVKHARNGTQKTFHTTKNSSRKAQAFMKILSGWTTPRGSRDWATRETTTGFTTRPVGREIVRFDRFLYVLTRFGSVFVISARASGYDSSVASNLRRERNQSSQYDAHVAA